MASPVSSTNSSSIAIEVQHLVDLVGACKVIENVNEFQYIIKAAIPNSKATLIMQLTKAYPEEMPRIFIKGLAKSSSTMVENRLKKQTNLRNLSELFKAAASLVSCINQQVDEISPKSEKRKQKKSKLKEDETCLSTKKPSMRTAGDVVKRIQWDSQLETDQFVVGYVDRFVGIIEQPFTSFNWVNPAAADWMDLNVPEHRIEYFKYKGKVVWDKKARIDDIFGSLGGVAITSRSSSSSDEQDMTEASQAASTNITDDLSDSDDSTSIILSAVQANTLAEIPKAANPLAKIPEAANPLAENLAMPNIASLKLSDPVDYSICVKDAITSSSSQSENRTRQPADPSRPNHFVAIPLNDPELCSRLNRICSAIVSTHPDLAEFRIDEDNFHITLSVLRVDSDNDLYTASQCLYEHVLDNGHVLTSSQIVTVEGLDNFWQRVLYAGVCMELSVHDFVQNLRSVLRNAGIKTFDHDTFVPHVTLFKIPPHCAKRYGQTVPKASEIQVKDYCESVSGTFGSQKIDRLCLYSMSKTEEGSYEAKFTVSVTDNL